MGKIAVVDRSEEKLVLANELGLHTYKSNLSQEIIAKKSVSELLEMKFKITTHANTVKKLTKRIWYGLANPNDWDSNYGYMFPWMMLSLMSFLFIPFGVTVNRWFFLGIPATPAAIFIGICLSRFKKCDVKQVRLSEWQHELPYGALLAVKEATGKGVSDFRIYYPTKQEERVTLDPIIVGYKNSVMVEVFFWDDRKMYE